MIDKYSIVASFVDFKIKYDFFEDIPSFFESVYHCVPTKVLPVILHDAPKGLSYFYWGTLLNQHGRKSFAERIINVRAEQVKEKPMLIRAVNQRRCIIPADGFYCQKPLTSKSAIPWRFSSVDKRLISFAGVWEEYEMDDGRMAHTFQLITAVAPDEMKHITARIPFILSDEMVKTWLGSSSSEAELLGLLNYPPYVPSLDSYAVSHKLNDSDFNEASLLLPSAAGDQLGNLTLFS